MKISLALTLTHLRCHTHHRISQNLSNQIQFFVFFLRRQRRNHKHLPQKIHVCFFSESWQYAITNTLFFSISSVSAFVFAFQSLRFQHCNFPATSSCTENSFRRCLLQMFSQDLPSLTMLTLNVDGCCIGVCCWAIGVRVENLGIHLISLTTISILWELGVRNRCFYRSNIEIDLFCDWFTQLIF